MLSKRPITRWEKHVYLDSQVLAIYHLWKEGMPPDARGEIGPPPFTEREVRRAQRRIEESERKRREQKKIAAAERRKAREAAAGKK